MLLLTKRARYRLWRLRPVAGVAAGWALVLACALLAAFLAGRGGPDVAPPLPWLGR